MEPSVAEDAGITPPPPVTLGIGDPAMQSSRAVSEEITVVDAPVSRAN
jgi:hypothetical protein